MTHTHTHIHTHTHTHTHVHTHTHTHTHTLGGHSTLLFGILSVSKYTTEESSLFSQRISNFASHTESFSESATATTALYVWKVADSKY
jgi:hypothetical protein